MDVSLVAETRLSADEYRDSTADSIYNEIASGNDVAQVSDTDNKFQSAISAWRSEFIDPKLLYLG